MENVDMFYGHLEYLQPFNMTVWYVLRSIGIYYSRFGMFGARKIWQPCCLGTYVNT
jgi:hypothetical protein